MLKKHVKTRIICNSLSFLPPGQQQALAFFPIFYVSKGRPRLQNTYFTTPNGLQASKTRIFTTPKAFRLPKHVLHASKGLPGLQNMYFTCPKHCPGFENADFTMPNGLQASKTQILRHQKACRPLTRRIYNSNAPLGL